MKKFNEQKEQLLMEIESTAEWRRQKAHEYPESKEMNLHAANELDKLATCVEKLPESHPVFETYWSLQDETKIENFNNEVRSYGYQNQSETPEEFVNRIVRETNSNHSAKFLDSIFEETE